MTSTLTARRLLAALLLAAVLAGCDDGAPFDPNRGNPLRAAYASDTTGLSPARSGAQLQVRVRLTGADRGPVADWPVGWSSATSSVLAGADAGTLSRDTTRTDEQGVAEVTWTLGREAATYTLRAHAANVENRNGAIAAPPLRVVVP